MELNELERLNGIQWSWVQVPLRLTFYSYSKESFSGEYLKYIYTYIHTYIYILYIYIYYIYIYIYRNEFRPFPELSSVARVNE